MDSDWISLFLPWPVRMRPGFRLDLAFSSLSCPNETRIQTESRFFLLDLSKWCLDSDWISLFFPCLVRMRPGFRLDLAFFALPCPNEAWIQTGSCFFGLALSEWDLHSDKFLLFWPCPVRMRPVFRQVLAFLALPCPNETCIQTGSCFFGLALSEWDLHSDKILLFLPCPVRMRPGFRLDLTFFALSCPNEARFQTRSSFFCLILSEWDLYSDSILLFPPCLVRILPAPGRLAYGARHQLIVDSMLIT